MTRQERFIISGVLILVMVLVGIDVFTDAGQGVAYWHILTEVFIGIAALGGVFYLLRGTISLKHRLQKEIDDFSSFKKEAEAWRADSKKYVEGLAKAIDQQLTKWNLTVAEKEVAFLLLKGFSLKEIASIRSTTEKTARVQSMSVYAKAGLSGRSELSAFFLEDLLLPANSVEERNSER